MFWAICCCTIAQTQSLVPTVIASAGIHAKGGDYHLHWTAGETAAGQYTTNSEGLTEGFNQFLEFDDDCDCKKIMGTFTINRQTVEITAFPNPADQLLIIQSSPNSLPLNIILTDITGKILKEQSLKNDRTELDVSDIPNALYFLTATDGFHFLHTMKINVIHSF